MHDQTVTGESSSPDHIQDISCDSLHGFWQAISPVGNLFGSPYMVFRGQAFSTWELIPSIFRKQVQDEYKYGMFAVGDNDYSAETYFEYTLLQQFLHYCDARGLSVPGDSQEFRKFMNTGPVPYSASRNDSWPDEFIRPFMALAQHHGIPTRLLDVTSNPYVAAYFAASSAIQAFFNERDEQDRADFARGKRLAVSAINYGTLHRLAGIDSVRVPGSTSPNLSAQSGSFLLVKNSGARGESFTLDVSIEQRLSALNSLSEELRTPIVDTLLVRVTLPVAYASDLLRWCRRHGISAATIFPGYDGAAKAAKEYVLCDRFEAAMKPSSRIAD